MPKLPMYVFKRTNGSYRYKRNVPKDLREVIAKATVYRQLGNTYAEAMPRFTIYSTHKSHFQNAVHSRLTVTLLSPSGVLW